MKERGVRITEATAREWAARGLTVPGYSPIVDIAAHRADEDRAASAAAMNRDMRATERGKWWPYKSRLEADRAAYYEALNLSYLYEPQGFRVGAAGVYWPDFKVSVPGAPRAAFHEVKGSSKGNVWGTCHARGIGKLQIAALLYPEYDWVLVRRDRDGRWTEEKVTTVSATATL